ncbi:MAG: VOC family protein [Gammaproteobacteria bacterium]|nr:VOC family protein [Gammaproteobacteria bacterium]
MSDIGEKISYVELPASDPAACKRFFSEVFGWRFTDYGPDYCSFSQSGVNGGFYRAPLNSSTTNGGALVVLYSPDLAGAEARITAAGGAICKPVFSFPGGRRFHFTDPCGNEWAVWSDQ